MVFVVVSGSPGAGKSTIGRAVADELRLPCLDKDDFLDRLLERSPNPVAERSTLSSSADAMLIESARQTDGAVLVSFWRRAELSMTSGTPTEWLATLPHVVELWCRCPPETAVHRFLTRRRHPGHGDETRSSDQLLEQFESLDRLGPLSVGRLVVIDNSGPMDIDGLAERILDAEAGRRGLPQSPWAATLPGDGRAGDGGA